MHRFLKTAPLAFVAALGLAGTSHAALTVYTDQAAWNAAVSNAGTDTFDDFSNTGTTATPIHRSAGSYNYSAHAVLSDFYGAGSGSDHWLSTNTATDTITFDSFSGSPTAIGGLFFTSNISGNYQPGDITITVVDSDGSAVQQIIGSTTSSFMGFTTTGSLVSLTVSAVQPGGAIWPTVNDFRLATAGVAGVPEPATWALMLGGFGLVGAAMRRRTRMGVTFA